MRTIIMKLNLLLIACLFSSSTLLAQESLKVGEQLRDAYFKGSVTNRSTGEKYDIFGGGVGIINNRKIALMYIMGFPFPSPSLDINGEVIRPITIKILGYDKEKKFLLPTKDSLVPKGEPDRSTGTAGENFTHAINVTWEFVNPGIAFETSDSTYISEKAAATIRFTREGIVTEGIKRIPKP